MIKKIIINIIIIYLFSGCYSLKKDVSKSLLTKDTVVYHYQYKDSVIHLKKVLITEAVTNQIELKEVCDSLGNLKPNSFSSKVGKTNLKIITKNNTIYVQANTDSIVNVYEFKYREKFKQDSVKLANYYRSIFTKNTVKETNNNWKWMVSIVLILALIIYLRIKSIV